jgi:hypothetical protein
VRPSRRCWLPIIQLFKACFRIGAILFRDIKMPNPHTSMMIRSMFYVLCLLQMLHHCECFETRGLHRHARVSAPSKLGRLGDHSASSSPHFFIGHPRQSSRPNTTTIICFSNNSDDNDGVDDPLGLFRGSIVFFVVFLFNVWLFSIPTEFRRNRFCTEEEVRLYPERNCMTSEMWLDGISKYYQNGGGAQFDFSIANKE